MVADMPVLLLFGDTERLPAMRHEVPVSIGDPLMFAEVDGGVTILTTWLERDRIAAVLPDAELMDFVDLGMRELVNDGLPRLQAEREVVTKAVGRLGMASGSRSMSRGDRTFLSFTLPPTPNSTTRFSARIRHNGNRICRQSGGNQHDAPARSHRARL
jgi:hypothetical protein